MVKILVKVPFNGVNDGEVYPKVYAEGVHDMGKSLAEIATKEGWGEEVADNFNADKTPDNNAPLFEVYTTENLSGLGRIQLNEIADAVGVLDAVAYKKKGDLIQAIIAAQPAQDDAGGDTTNGGEA